MVTLLTYPTGTGGEFIVVSAVPGHREGPYAHNKGIGDAGSTADIRMLWPWSALVCLGLL